MGVNSKLRDIRPPLPAPTESNDEGGTTSGFDTDVATQLTTATDKTSYEIPEDGKPIKIATERIKHHGHARDQSQTSLLIEYFEGSKGDRTRSKPSVRVKVTPSARKKSGSGGPDAIQITGIGKDRKPSYTRRISLGSSKNAEIGVGGAGATEVSHSSGSTLSGRPPIEVEVLDNNGSDLSTQSRGLQYAPADSNVSSMPPDSMLEGSNMTESELSVDRGESATPKGTGYLDAPRSSDFRSASQERLVQKVMQKVNQGQSTTPRKSSRSKSERSLSGDYASKSRQFDEDAVSGADSSLLSSNTKSYRSGSDVSNNPRLLGMVEDTIRRIILPEINALKEDQKQDRNIRSFESSRRPSILEDMYSRKGLDRSLSKSSSSPNISSKPKIMLNQDDEDPGVVLSRGDSERKKMRKSSRGSYKEERPSSRRSSGGSTSRGYDNGDTVRARSSKSSSKLRDAAAIGGGAALTGAALRSLERDNSPDQRKRRSKSRGSRSKSSFQDDLVKEEVPPMPMASHINDSEITRTSIASGTTETPYAQGQTPVREVSRGSLRDVVSPASSPATRRTRELGQSPSSQSIGSPKSPRGGLSAKERLAALTGAGIGAVATAKGVEHADDDHRDGDGYGGSSPITYRKTSSPAQSVSSLKKTFEEQSLKPKELRSRSAASRSSAGRDKNASRSSLRSDNTSPGGKLLGSRQQSSRSMAEDFVTPAEEFAREPTPGTPTYGESVDEWWERQHHMNDQYRNSLGTETNRDSFAATTNRDSYQTNPYPQDEKRFTYFSEDGQEDDRGVDEPGGERDVRPIGAVPRYVHSPHGAESAVASLVIEPSNVSSSKSKLSGYDSPAAKPNNSFSARIRELNQDSPPIYQGSTLSQTMPSEDRWQALKGRARDISGSREDVVQSPGASKSRDLGLQRSMEPVMTANSLPLANDPLPEIGHFDDSKSDVTTNPSIIQGPLGGDASGKDTWPYTPEPDSQAQRDLGHQSDQGLHEGYGKDAALLGAGAAAATGLAGAKAFHQPRVDDDDEDRLTPDIGRQRGYGGREATPTSPAAFRDEGYATDAQARSAGALTPEAEQKPYNKRDVDEYHRAMAAYSGDKDDPFTAGNDHSRNVSGNSHGMETQYDPTTGRGNIQSKDIVALMDHLTVRDSQRNARDTEILVTLVRSAAEMRQSFDEIKKFIVEQDRMIMQNADRSADQAAQKALSGPRPQPASSPRTPRQSQEEIQTKRKGVLRRALKGLTGSKSANDLAKVEGMLMQILDNVEDLKHQSGPTRDTFGSQYTTDSLDTYERLRNAPDSGYEPEGIAGTSSTPSHSGQLSLTPRGEKQQFHSGYDGRRGSVNRVSTVLEGDEEELEPHENYVLEHQFENNEGMLTPTQESQRSRGLSPVESPSRMAGPYPAPDEITPRSTEKQRKSYSSSVFGVPKISRWSKTTSSSAAPDPNTLDSPNMRYQRPISQGSGRTGSAGGRYDDDGYGGDRMSSTQSLPQKRDMEIRSIRSQASKMTRTPSPLIPSEASYRDDQDYDNRREPSPIQDDLDHELDDPKYQAHRNSLNLQHPQPRQGPTGRHQTTLETQAHTFEVDPTRTSSDLSQRSVSDFDPATWGSSGTAGLAKHRLSQLEPLSPSVNLGSSAGYGSNRHSRDDDSLIPQKSVDPPKARYEPEPEPEAEEDWEPTYSNSGFSRGGYYSSPFGSGHLLEPIEEVESIVDVERQISPEPQVASAKAVDMRSTARKITGPRPMGTKSPAAQARIVDTSGTVRRKPVGGASDGYD